MNQFTQETEAAFEAADAYMRAWNAEDQEGMADACHFPHIRMASGKVLIWEQRSNAIIPRLFDRMKEAGWRRSAWNHRRVVHEGTDKVHLDVSFTRYGEDDVEIGVYLSLWVMTKEADGWGIQARSSYAP